MTNPFILTLTAIFLTLTGQAPIEAWFPLFEDIFTNTIVAVVSMLEVVV